VDNSTILGVFKSGASAGTLLNTTNLTSRIAIDTSTLGVYFRVTAGSVITVNNSSYKTGSTYYLVKAIHAGGNINICVNRDCTTPVAAGSVTTALSENIFPVSTGTGFCQAAFWKSQPDATALANVEDLLCAKYGITCS
jgi:hypothetical protein